MTLYFDEHRNHIIDIIDYRKSPQKKHVMWFSTTTVIINVIADSFDTTKHDTCYKQMTHGIAVLHLCFLLSFPRGRGTGDRTSQLTHRPQSGTLIPPPRPSCNNLVVHLSCTVHGGDNHHVFFHFFAAPPSLLCIAPIERGVRGVGS